MGRTPLPVRPLASDWLNTFEAAAYLNVSLRFVRQALRYDIPIRQAGRRQPIYFHKRDLDTWSIQNTQVPVA